MWLKDMKNINRISGSTANTQRCCTELELHAYVDGELALEERGYVLESAVKSNEIRSRLNELKQLKELVHLSYTQVG